MWAGGAAGGGRGEKAAGPEEAGPAAAAATRAAAAAAGKQERIAGSSSQLEPVSQLGQSPAKPVSSKASLVIRGQSRNPCPDLSILAQ